VSSILFKNAHVFDGSSPERLLSHQVLVVDGFIEEVSASVTAEADEVIDVGGRTLMPGMIDVHIHAYGSDVSAQKVDEMGEPYRTAHATRMLGHALDCGFTSVRDVGGGDWSLARAIEEGLIRAPRFFYSGKILSMTGGHGDFRSPSQSQHTSGYCSCGSQNSLCVIADGVDECVKAAREQLRRGAHCVKIMCSGGVVSPTDPVWMNQYREDEIQAVVEECRQRRTYVAAHCHPASAIRRAIECGVRCIEHGTLIDDATAQLAARTGTYIVPTAIIMRVLVELGRELGFPAANLDKVIELERHALGGLQVMRAAGVKVGFGTDLIGKTYVQRCREFILRKQVFSELEILRQATGMGAEILMEEGKLGCIRPGAHADLLIVDGNPLEDISLLARDGAALSIVMKAGQFQKRRGAQ
jgi:imidazolonepropionase-like amidohydrolase